MGLTVEQAAAGMYRVACNNMAQGVREVTIKRGFDPREFPLIPGGGAGPIHGCLICSELEIPLQIVPREASVLCAFGMLMCELRHDFVRTFVARLEGARLGAAGRAGRGDDATRATRLLAEERIPPERRRVELRLDCRYLKQYHEVSVAVPLEVIARRDARRDRARASTPSTSGCTATRCEAEGSPVEIINVRLQAIGATDRPERTAARPRRQPTRAPRSRAGAASTSPSATPSPRCRSTTGTACAAATASTARRSSSSRRRRSSSAQSYDCVVDALGSFVLYAKGREDLLDASLASGKRR